MENRENLLRIDSAIFNSQKGYANQLISCGIMLKLGYEAMLAETGNSFYDLIVLLNDGEKLVPIKTGVRTLSRILSFGVNSGGGVGRARPAGRGVQLPTLDQVQLWVGITPDYDIYYFPHKPIYGKTRDHRGVMKPIGSLSKNVISHTKNNTDILDNFFNDDWLEINVLNNIRGSEEWQAV